MLNYYQYIALQYKKKNFYEIYVGGNGSIKIINIFFHCCSFINYDYIMNWFLDKLNLDSKVKVKTYLFMKYTKNIQNKVFQEKIFKNL